MYAAACGGAAALYGLLSNTIWVGNWQGGVVSATTNLSWMLPGVVLAAGIDGRRYSCVRELSPASSARPVGRLTTTLAAIATAPALAMLTLILTTFAINANASQFAFPGYLTLALPFVFIAGYTSWGFICGRFLEPVLLVPVAAVTGYLMPVLLAYYPDARRALLSPVDNGAVSPPVFLRWEAVLTQIVIGAVLFLGIVVFLLLDGQIRDHQRRRDWWPRAVVAVATLAILGTILGLADPRRHYEATGASGAASCRSSHGLTVCTWPDHSPLLSPALRVSTRLLDTLGDAWASRPQGLVEYGLRSPDQWAAFSTGTTYASDRQLAASLAAALVARLVCREQGGLPRLTPDVVDREQWLLTAAGYLPIRDASPGVRHIRLQPLAVQREWWVDVAGEARAC